MDNEKIREETLKKFEQFLLGKKKGGRKENLKKRKRIYPKS